MQRTATQCSDAAELGYGVPLAVVLVRCSKMRFCLLRFAVPGLRASVWQTEIESLRRFGADNLLRPTGSITQFDFLTPESDWVYGR